MNIRGLIVTLSTLSFGLLILARANASNSVDGDGNGVEIKSLHTFGLPRMFDFQDFKKKFHKAYGSSIEEMVRLKTFLARTYEVFVSAVAYLHRRSSYFKAINMRSDWTAQELEASRNKLAAWKTQNEISDEHEETLDERERLVEPEELRAELDAIRRNAQDPRYAPLAAELARIEESGRSGRRRKRSLPLSFVMDHFRPRDNFKVEAAFNRHDLGSSQPPPKRSEREPAGNNPAYQQPELVTMGRRKFAEEPGYKRMLEKDIVSGVSRDYGQLPVKSKHRQSGLLNKLTSAFISSSWFGSAQARDSEGPEEEPDVVWVDHRQSGCLNPVQDQGKCNGCYAFSSLALLEWAHCNRTGQPIKFSEQYMIDCGKTTSEWLAGCEGGDIISAGEFVSNFGLELASHYPYMSADGTCPYHPEAERDSMGYLRVDLSNVIKVGLEYAETYLRVSPMVASIHAESNMDQYGGGVFDGKNCNAEPNHLVVLVGHGREDGEEYWLLRNSYGPSWGEAGHIKLNKNSDCIHPRRALVYRSAFGWNIELGLRKNAKMRKV